MSNQQRLRPSEEVGDYLVGFAQEKAGGLYRMEDVDRPESRSPTPPPGFTDGGVTDGHRLFGAMIKRLFVLTEGSYGDGANEGVWLP